MDEGNSPGFTKVAPMRFDASRSRGSRIEAWQAAGRWRNRLEPIVRRSQHHDDRTRMQGLGQRLLEQGRKLSRIGRAAGPTCQILQQVTRVVRAAEEGTIEPLGGFTHPTTHRESDDHSEHRSRNSTHAPGPLSSGEGLWQDARERPREYEREHQADDDAEDDDGVVDDEIPSAPPEEHRNLHHAMLGDGVGKRQRQEQDRHDRADPHPEWQLDELEVMRLGVGPDDDERYERARCPPQQDARAFPGLRTRDKGVQDE